MNCLPLQLDGVETINIIISAVIGLALSYFAAWSYERFQHRRKMKEQWKKFQHLEGNGTLFDWQHWDVKDGRIAECSIASYMRLKYENVGEFHYQWKEAEDGEIMGEGHMTFDDRFNGNLYFFTTNTISYKYRNVFYRRIKHLERNYDAIFVDADDQNKNYVMMRPIV
ncbi:LapA family protein [Pedobacter heparinus]|uniref:LapA family protein n=1 Tax=Pedobacter heparinus TaxID=984 RepID=UPI00292DA42C|nr:LapA family protein [Pedobacter heparinus]